MKLTYSLTLLILLTFSTLTAQDGTLDANFGTNGLTILDNGTDNAEILSLTKSNDKLIGAGFTSDGGTEVFTVVRFNLDGSLDTSFGTSGYVKIPLGTGNGRANSIVLQADGNYVVGGWARFSNKEQYVLARILTNGMMDNSFGTNGVVTGSFSGSTYAEDEIAEVQLLSDEKIIVAGKSYNGLNDDVFVACFNTDGTLYTGFNGTGFRIIEFGTSPPYEEATSVAIDAQDNIIIGGRVSLDFFDEDSFFLTKLDNSGATDNSFGDNGKLYYTIAPNVIAGLNVIKIDNEGRIVTGGGAFDTDDLDNNFFLTRFSANGTLDTSFGNNGEVIIPRIDNESIYDLEILPSDDIIASGSTGGFPSGFATVRLNDNGVHDLTFGNNGWAITQPESDFNSLRSIVVDATAIYGGGVAKNSSTWKMAVAKYINAGTTSADDLLKEDLNVQVYPNPISTEFSIQFNMPAEGKINIQMTDIFGRQVAELLPLQSAQQGNHKFSFATPKALAKGTYFFVLKVNDEMVSQLVSYQ